MRVRAHAAVTLTLCWSAIVVQSGPVTLQGSGDAVTVRFAAGDRAVGIPFELHNNQIYLKVAVNESGPLWFILDTGASQTVLALRQARTLRLGLHSVGKVEGGIGEPADAYLATDAVSFAVPGIVISDASVAIIPLDLTEQCLRQSTESATAPPAVDGILGLTLFRSLVVAIDYEARSMGLYSPRTYAYRGKGRTVALEADAQHIFVRGEIKAAGRAALPARFLIDTGSATALSLTRPFTEVHRLLPPPDKVTPSIECGIGGNSTTTNVVGTVEAVKLGGLTVVNPTAVFNTQPAARDYDVLLGNPILERFDVVFDYSRRRMHLSPRHPQG